MFRLPFELKQCPQDCGKECGVSLTDCPTYQKLPESLQEKCKENLHLLQYLHGFPMDEFGIPEYYEKLNRSLKGKKDPNLIYPVDSETFIHIMPNPADVRDHYIPVEPKDPLTSGGYLYCGISATSYHLGATLEESSNSALSTDVDFTSTTCSVGGTAFNGATELVYDVKP